MAIKKFKCEYYQLTEEVPNAREAFFDLEAWINIMEGVSLAERTRPYKEDSVRLEQAYYHPNYECWFLRFMRQRPNDVPSLSGPDIPSEFMDLEDNQFVSEDVSCLFDPENNVIMVQKNSHSVSPVGLEQYFNNTTPNETVVHLRKIVATDSFQKVRRSRRCRKIIVRVADMPTLRARGLLDNLRSTVGQMVRAMQETPSPYLEFTYSVGMDRSLEVDEDEVNAIVDDIQNNPIVFDRAKVNIIEENETKQRMVDLFLDSPKDEISFNTERNNPIRFDAMMDALGQKYCQGNGRENRKRDINFYLRR
ncbi:DUF6731 family protein [Enterococcus hermanniensis]|uniref:Uncharacterized protein n=1 Tax=Enterococcus hermanniensis TaxID=249189 RepID=A0A1L8TRK0_9ENTE|nr:DUF6731 family protein [Enterococcus hermanniensis]OJG46939.1 hypothetical protein RV04_GL000186 [Enterococcus hermanniensis]